MRRKVKSRVAPTTRPETTPKSAATPQPNVSPTEQAAPVSLRTLYSFVEAEFTPKEVAKITGVSQDLQRDWRRRGFVAASGSGSQSRYRAFDLGYLFALKRFSDMGVSVIEAQSAASAAMMPIWDFIAFAVTGFDNATNVDADRARFIFWQSGGRVMRGSDLSWIAKEDVAAEGKAVVTVIFDCMAAATQLIKHSPRELVSVKVEKK